MTGVASGVVLALLVGGSLLAADPVSSANRSPDERPQIAGVVRDYFEGWYTADPDRMGQSLHPDMVKRYVDALPGGRQVVHSATRELMIEMTRGGGGSKVAPGSRDIAVDVLDVSGEIAVARASSSE